jgi:hypothetical protein
MHLEKQWIHELLLVLCNHQEEKVSGKARDVLQHGKFIELNHRLPTMKKHSDSSRFRLRRE